jgi:NAD(P)-dependent dehydrogenase (short-subunit alcohol dehydrogenase family)
MKISVPNELKGRVVAVTGGARGIGRTIVDSLLDAGAKVVATDRSWKDVEKPVGGEVLVCDMDVTKDDQIDAAFRATMDRFGTVHGLVNNAAIRQRELFPPTGRVTTLETKDSDWERAFAVNVFGALKVTRRFIRPMIEAKRGSIVCIVSNGILYNSHGGAYLARRPDSREMPYQSTKAALAMMSFYLADERKANDIAVNIIAPGHTRTSGFDEQNRARLKLGVPHGLQPLKPESMVPLVCHLLAQTNATISGRMFDVTEWNLEHGLGGHAEWYDDFSYEALLADIAATADTKGA